MPAKPRKQSRKTARPRPQAQEVVAPVVVRISTAAKMLDCGRSSVYDLCVAGKLKTVWLKSDRRITVESINRYARGDV